MDDMQTDVNRQLMLDGNAVAGLLQEIFSTEMTASPAECATCGHNGDVGELLVFGQSMGSILRCPACGNVVMRVVETPKAIYLDTRGATYLRLSRPSAARQ